MNLKVILVLSLFIGLSAAENSFLSSLLPTSLVNMYNKSIEAVDFIKTINNFDNFDDGFKNIRNIFSYISKNWKPIEKRLETSFWKFIDSLNMTEECVSAVHQVVDGMANSELWAYQYSSGKIPASMTAGTTTSFGDYDLCLGIKSQENMGNASNNPVLYGKYCMVRPYLSITNFKKLDKFRGFKYLKPQTNKFIKQQMLANANKMKMLLTINSVTEKMYLFNYGLCMPHTCSAAEISRIYNKFVKPFTSIPVDVGPDCDVITDQIDWNPFNRAVILITLAFVSLTLICTILSVIFCKSKKEDINRVNNSFKRLLNSFSWFENNRCLFTPYRDRLWSCEVVFMTFTLWYDLSVTYGCLMMGGLVGFKKLFNSYAVDAATEPEYWWLRTTAHRDCLFMLSGIIISYDFFGKKNIEIGFISYFQFVLEKYYRFLPKMISAIIFFQLLTLFGNGPNFSGLRTINNCQQTYWRNLLMINGFSKDGKMCLYSTFFISTFFLLHIISPLFLVPLYYYPKLGLLYNLLVFIVAAFVKVVPKLYFGLQLIPFEISQLSQLKDMKQSLWRVFTYPDQYIYLFIYGIVVGYWIRTYPAMIDMLTKSRWRTIPLTVIAFAIGSFGIIWSENFKYIDKKHNQLDISAWFICGMVFISILLTWLIILYYKNGLSSSKWFSALIRLTPGILVNHTAVSIYTVFTMREEVAVKHSNQLKTLAQDMVTTIIASYILYILFESPLIRLLEMIKNKSNDSAIRLSFNSQKSSDKSSNGSHIEMHHLAQNGQNGKYCSKF